MNQVDEFKTFLESIYDLNPSLVDGIMEGTDTIFESAKRKKKKAKRKSKSMPYYHPYQWGGWFTGNYSGGVNGVTDTSDIGMGTMASAAGDGGGGE